GGEPGGQPLGRRRRHRAGLARRQPRRRPGPGGTAALLLLGPAARLRRGLRGGPGRHRGRLRDRPHSPGPTGRGDAEGGVVDEGWGVVVGGGGNAARCGALAARERGARVLVLEKAPEPERGGNSLFTAGGFRFAHHGLDDLRRDVLVDLSDEEAA